ncbi:hypothetical protein [Acinetobacter oleivorans]|uniref:hypothetical protein n=1 Tax=Acinetobacter oleivorans TaxID=1148157 RepID=UPI003A887340
MINWIEIKKDQLPMSDEAVLVKTSNNNVYSAYLDLEDVPEDETVWKRTWLSNLNSAEIEDYLDVDEVLTHWSVMPI